LDTSSSRGGAISGARRGGPEKRLPGGLPTGEERARLVREMFDRISGRYELLNTLMSAGLNSIWNKKALQATGLRPGDRALDLACGAGSLTRELAKRVGPDGYVLGFDFSEEMLKVARGRPAPNIEYQLGDATNLEGLTENSFDAATIAYGARNIPGLDALFAEMVRMVRPNGKVVCLEIARPEGRFFAAFYGLWFDRLVPWLGAKVSGDDWAYSYLPESVKEFVASGELAEIMERNGLQDVTWRKFSGGIVTLHSGTKPG
jgi:demethylmenaquinone methyltransferase / 2-methoxy-6-polyprenyl-1,4-benzoquinol methylase